jgi:hypothetical protein
MADRTMVALVAVFPCWGHSFGASLVGGVSHGGGAGYPGVCVMAKVEWRHLLVSAGRARYHRAEMS